MKRIPELQNLVDSFAKKVFGRTQTESQAQNVCVVCGRDANHFKDEISRKEYQITGLCQKCQNETFG